MSTYTANLIKDADTTTPTSGTWTVPEADDAIREIKRIVAYNEGVTAVSAYPATVAVTDTTLYCTGAGGTLNIPQLSTVSTTAYQKRIVVINDSAAAITFDPYSTETVGGASTYSIPAGTIVEFLGHGGTDWTILNKSRSFLGGSVRFASSAGTGTAISIVGATESAGEVRQIIAPSSCIINNFYARSGVNSLNGAATLSVRKNGVDTSLIVTIPAGNTSTISDTTHSVSFVAGDNLDIFLDAAGSSGNISQVIFGMLLII